MPIKYVLDASALLALLMGEPGAEEVAEILGESCIGAVNLAEVLAKLVQAGAAPDTSMKEVGGLGLPILDWDESMAAQSADLANLGRTHGLSLGDRACLTLARSIGVPAVTAETAWETLPRTGVKIRLVRQRRTGRNRIP